MVSGVVAGVVDASPPGLRRVLGDSSAQVCHARADGAEVRVIADGAPVAHREGVFPRSEERLQFRS
jgi:hypothetical protein